MSYLSKGKRMGTWKLRKLTKGLRASRTRSSKGKFYVAYPPLEGWKGGHPSDNGYKAGKGR